jgi:ribosomal protein L7Ae-like RNA K-turn-binding protein
MDKLLNFLGLCCRAGKLTTGNDAVKDKVLERKAKLVLTSSDISKNTEKKMLITCHKNDTKALRLPRTTEQLSLAVGRFCAVVAVLDSGFATKLVALIENEKQEENVYD